MSHYSTTTTNALTVPETQKPTEIELVLHSLETDNQVDTALCEWLKEKIGESRSKKTFTAYWGTIRQLRQSLRATKGLDLDANTREDHCQILTDYIRNFVELRHPTSKHHGLIARTTVNQRLAIISSFYRFVESNNRWKGRNPVKAISRRRVQDYDSAQSLSTESVQAGFKKMNQSTLQGKRDFALFVIGLSTGIRLSALAGITLEDVQVKDGATRIKVHEKGGEEYTHILSTEAAKALHTYLEGLRYLDDPTYPEERDSKAPIWINISRNTKYHKMPLGLRGIALLCKKYFHVTKVHTLRHTLTEAMHSKGASIREISEQLHHKNIATTQRYFDRRNAEKNPYADDILADFLGKEKEDS
jgi:site-specific recombinase XerD